MTIAKLPKNLIIAASCAVLVVIIGFWFYFTYADNPTIPRIMSSAKNAIFTMDSPSKVYLNQPFKIRVQLDTNQNTINAVGLIIKYESEKIKILGLDTTLSFCQLYPEKKFNDNQGLITLSCGSPSPGFSGQNTIVIIEAMPYKIGTTSFIVDHASKILESDGEGTNLVTSFPISSINIINSL